MKRLFETIIMGAGAKLVRFNYPCVFEPRAVMPGQSKKYSVQALIEKSDAESVNAIKRACSRLIKEAETQGMWSGGLPANFRNPLRDGDEDAKRSQCPAYQGMYFLNASSKFKPGIVDAQGRAIIEPAKFYAGCWGRVQLVLFTYDKMGNAGIGVGLNNLQKVRDGEPLAGRQSAEDAFKGLGNSIFEPAFPDAGLPV